MLCFLSLHFRSTMGKITWTDEKIAANEDHKVEKMRKLSLKTIIKIPRHTKSITDDKADLKEQGVQKTINRTLFLIQLGMISSKMKLLKMFLWISRYMLNLLKCLHFKTSNIKVIDM